MTKHSITLQTQPTNTTCAHTCVAMVLGVPVEEIIKKYGGDSLNQEKLTYILTDNKVWWNGLTNGNLVHSGWYFAVVPSLNNIGVNHQVLIYYNWDNGELLVFDPARGKKYDEKGRDLKSWSNLIAIQL